MWVLDLQTYGVLMLLMAAVCVAATTTGGMFGPCARMTATKQYILL
jgi:hypothetical protein